MFEELIKTKEVKPEKNIKKISESGYPIISVQSNFAKGKEKFFDKELMTPYATAIIDPDWPYTDAPGSEDIKDLKNLKNGERLWGFTHNRDARQNQYKQEKPLSIEELKKLPIGEVVGGYIFLWTVGPFLVNGAASALMNSWGFIPKSILSWAKFDLRTKHGYGGVGYWLLGNAEFCIIGKRKEWPSIRTGKSSLIIAPKTSHSEKPDDIHKLCEERFPGPYLEIFGRRRREGWKVIGNEAPDDGFDITDSLRKILMAHRRKSFLNIRKYALKDAFKE